MIYSLLQQHGASIASRQQAREALDHLVRLGETYGTAFLLVCHTNKKKTDDWRQRISGSADLPDIARSVIFTDYTEIKPHQEIRFISNEKNSYHAPQETLLYHFDEGKLVYCGFSAKKFADYANHLLHTKATPRIIYHLQPKYQRVAGMQNALHAGQCLISF